VIERILAAIEPRSTDRILEIGPGRGALTAPLLERVDKLYAVEVDRDLADVLAPRLSEHPGFELHRADILTFDLEGVLGPRSLRVVGNLPYNISTPVLFRMLSFSTHLRDMHFMLQREVVARMAEPPGSKLYGRLSVMVQARARVQLLFDVAPGAFAPPPKVWSTVVRLIPYRHPATADIPMTFLEGIVARAFAQRRKTLRNSLRSLLEGVPEPRRRNLGLERRPETLSLEDFVALARVVREHGITHCPCG